MHLKIFGFLFLLIHSGVWAGNYKKVVATSTWTAAYAYAAGFENVAILAPANMLHPSEYELTPKEIKLLLNADLIVYAGYEVMSKFIENELKDSKVECVKIETNYNLNKIETSVNLLAQKNGTVQQAQSNLEDIRQAFQEARTVVKRVKAEKQTLAVHFFQQPYIEAIGLKANATFGPAPLEAFEIRELGKSKLTLIVDNYHNTVSGPLAELFPKSKVVKLLNFPGQHNTRTLADVIRYNTLQISDAINNEQ